MPADGDHVLEWIDSNSDAGQDLAFVLLIVFSFLLLIASIVLLSLLYMGIG